MERIKDEWFCHSKWNAIDRSVTGSFVNLRTPLTLEHMALVSFAVRLWEDEVRTRSIYHLRDYKYKIYFFYLNDYKYEILEEEVLKKLDIIFSSNSLRMKASNIIRLIAYEMRAQITLFIKDSYVMREIYENEDFRCSFYWTSDGTIDVAKSIENLINSAKDRIIKQEHFISLYELACKYCLEKCISELWLKMCGEINEHTNSIYSPYSGHFVAYWTAVKKKELMSKLLKKLQKEDYDYIYDSRESICVNMVSLSFHLKNVVAFKYFWQKLTDLEKNTFHTIRWFNKIVASFPGISSDKIYFYEYLDLYTYRKILCFLLSQLSGSGQLELFKNKQDAVLDLLTHCWPLQRFLLPAITAMMEFLREDVYLDAMERIVNAFETLRLTPTLLGEILCGSTLKLKNAFILYLTENAKAIVYLISINDHETLDMILENASALEKKRIAFSLVNEYQILVLMDSNKLTLQMIEVFISKALSLNSDRDLFKRKLAEQFVEYLYSFWYTCRKLHRGFHTLIELLDWSFQSEEILKFKENHIDPIRMYRLLIHSIDYESLNTFLNWYFESEEKIIKFKRDFAHRDNCDSCGRFLDFLYYLNTDKWNLFQIFCSNGNFSREEQGQFKMIFLKKVEYRRYTLEYISMEFLTLLLNFCLNSPDEIDQFKIKFFNENTTLHLQCIIHDHFPDWVSVKEVLKYLSSQQREEANYYFVKYRTWSYCKDYVIGGYTVRNRTRTLQYLLGDSKKRSRMRKANRQGGVNPYLRFVI